MMEQVDIADLKSAGHCGRVGSSPILGTTGYVIIFNDEIIVIENIM